MNVYLDPGHGGKDSGAYDPVNALQGDYITTKESTFALSTAKYAKTALIRSGVSVAMSRTDDTFVSLAQRIAQANTIMPTLYVAIHYNAASATSARGIEIFAEASGTLSDAAAKWVMFYAKGLTPWPDRGVKYARGYPVLDQTKSPAILFEGGFITNTEEERLLTTQLYQFGAGEALAKGVCKALGVNYIPIQPKVNVDVDELVVKTKELTLLNDTLNKEAVAARTELSNLRAENTILKGRVALLEDDLAAEVNSRLVVNRQLQDYVGLFGAIRDAIAKTP
jgi:N-acetylmuramoyl-L-alanine amidase